MTQIQNPLKSLLKEKGIRQIDIARKLGIRRVNIHNVIYGNDASARIVAAIADELGLSVDQVKALIPDRAA